MSRAFVNEDQAAAQADQPVERLVSAQPNYVTPTGLAQLQAKVAQLHSQHSEQASLGDQADPQRQADIERDLRYFQQRLQSAQVVTQATSTTKVQIGSRVTFADEQGSEQQVQLVGKTRPMPPMAWSTGARPWVARYWARNRGMRCCGIGRQAIRRSRSSASNRPEAPQTTPWANMASATLTKPAMFAPLT